MQQEKLKAVKPSPSHATHKSVPNSLIVVSPMTNECSQGWDGGPEERLIGDIERSWWGCDGSSDMDNQITCSFGSVCAWNHKKNYTSCGCVHGITTDKTREEQQTHWLALLHHDQLHKDIYHHTTFRVHPDHRGPNIKKEPEPTDGTVCSVASLFQIVRWKNEGCIGPRRS